MRQPERHTPGWSPVRHHIARNRRTYARPGAAGLLAQGDDGCFILPEEKRQTINDRAKKPDACGMPAAGLIAVRYTVNERST